MDDLREKVIKGLECCTNGGDCQNQCDEWPDNGCVKALMRSALSILKAQEPRVMTLEEIKAWACKPGSQKDAVYIQNFNDPELVWAYLGRFESDSGIGQFDGYGYSWRCWTSRPTDKQREQVKWDQ
jgi:hypothetical protein